MEQDLNRIKLVLVEKKKTGKWLAQELGVSECTVSRWASNKAQPNLSSLNAIAKLLGVEKKDLLNSATLLIVSGHCGQNRPECDVSCSN